MSDSPWLLYKGTGEPHSVTFPEPPPWRAFKGVVHTEPDRGVANATRGRTFQANKPLIDLVNTALYLRRPILLTGKPGIGKSSLAYAVAHELQLGRVLTWPITTRATLQEGLYRYDAIARLQQQQLNYYASITRVQAPQGQQPSLNADQDIDSFLRLGPVGTALLPSNKPRVLLIDEIDKSDIDLPNDLLHIFEEGRFEIPELTRLSATQPTPHIRPWDSERTVPIVGGVVECREFPLVILTNNGEREFPPAFLRRCLRMTLQPPDKVELQRIVEAHFVQIPQDRRDQIDAVITDFFSRQQHGDLSTDQLLNAVHLVLRNIELDKTQLESTIWKYLSAGNNEQL
jgi:MoxR-like ATPase